MMAIWSHLPWRLAAVLLVAGLVVGCFKPSDCTEGDFRELFATQLALRYPDQAALLDEDAELSIRSFYPEWMKDAKLCEVGQYSVIAPAKGETSEIWVHVRDGGPTVSIAADFVHVWEPPRRIVATLHREESGERFDRLSYDAWGLPDGAHITVTDTDLDGNPDMRTTWYPPADGREFKWERSVGNCWWTEVRQNDEAGLLIDGEFYPLEEAKAKILTQSEKPVDSPEPSKPE
jgi:hypothetical protein